MAAAPVPASTTVKVPVAEQSFPLGPLLDALVNTDDPPVDATVLRDLSGTEDQRYWVLRELQERLERAAMAGPW